MPDQPQNSKPDADSPVQERIQELSWALLDEQISADEMSLLDNLLLSDAKARESYIDCVQLHTDLMAHFAALRPPASGTPAKSPVLGFLNAGMPPLGLQSHPAEGTGS